MHEKILLVAFLVTQLWFCQILGAPNCDLRSIFRTPRDFDQFELIERSNFEQDKRQDIRLNEDIKPHANAQILLRIGCDKEDEQKSKEPCIPLSQLLKQNVVQKEVAPQFQPTIYQQHLNPYHTQAPFVFPHCLYYDALGSLCSHLLPLVKEVLGTNIKAKSVQGTIAVENKSECLHLEEGDAVDEIRFNTDDSQNDSAKKKQANEANVESGVEKAMPMEADEENVCDNPLHEHKKAQEGKPKDKVNIGEKKTSKRQTHKRSHIQKIPADGKVDEMLLVEEGSNDVLHELRMSVNKDGNEDEQVPPKEEKAGSKHKDIKNSKLSNYISKTDENSTTVLTNTTNVSKLLDDALVPIDCHSCDKTGVKNVISYPIFNKKPGDEKIRINIENCGCLNTLEDETNSTHNHSPFSVDLDDLTLMHGEPVTQASLVRNMAPKFLRNIVAAKTLPHYLQVAREQPQITLVPYNEGHRSVELLPNICPGCMCKHCVCNTQRPSVYEEQPRLVVVEQPYEEDVVRVVPSYVHRPSSGYLPSYMSRQMSRPLAIYETAVADNTQDILVPVDVVPAQAVIAERCGRCAPYAGELNES